MKTEIILMRTDSEYAEGKSIDGEMTLTAMQEIVGGLIEVIPVKDKYMVINEEGHLRGLPYNKVANDILWTHRPDFAAVNTIVGNAFLISKTDLK